MFWNWFQRPLSKSEIDTRIEEVVNPIRDALPVRFLEDMQRLEVKDGDVIVLRHPMRLSADDIVRLQTFFGDILDSASYKLKVLVLDEGMGIGVLGKSALDCREDSDG